MGLDRRTALKRARELFEKGDRRGASKALLEAGFSGSQVEAVFEGFLLEPLRKEARPPPRQPPAPPPSRDAAREKARPPTQPRSHFGTRGSGAEQRPPEPVKPGGDLLRSLRRMPWRPVAAAAGAAVLVAALLFMRPTAVEPPPVISPTGPVETPPPLDLSLPGVASVALEGCAWSDWTGDGNLDGVAASVRFREGAGGTVAVGLPPGSLQATAAVRETVDRPRFENVNGSLFFNGTVTETRLLTVSGVSVVPSGGGWSLQVSGPASARSRLSRLEEASYTLEAAIKTSVMRSGLAGSCKF